MPRKNKQRPADEDGYWNRDRNGLEGPGSDDIRNEDGSNNTSANLEGRSRDHQGIRSLTELDLGEYTQAANDTIHRMRQAHRAVQALSEQYAKHVNEIKEIAEIRSAYVALSEQNKFKDKKIKDHKTTIETLQEGTRERAERLAAEEQTISNKRSQLEKDVDKLAKDKETLAKRFQVQQAELKTKLDKELQKLQSENERILSDRKTALEVDSRKQRQETEKIIAELENKNSGLREKNTEYLGLLEGKKKELVKARQESDDQERSKKSWMADAQKLEAKLQAMQNEFGLNTETPESYKVKFREIYKGIESISVKYFRRLNREEDFELTSKTPLQHEFDFAVIPISESEVSQRLRIARAQAVISSIFCKVIWQPFSTEKTISSPEFSRIFDEIAGALAGWQPGGGSGGRSARVWSALTMRALYSRTTTSPQSQTPSLQNSLSQYSSMVVDKVFSALSSLVVPSQVSNFQRDLLALTQSAISAWYTAQTDELQITVYPSLDRDSYKDWQNPMADSAVVPQKHNYLVLDGTASTQARVYTLFPRITAKTFKIQDHPAESLPGSWPDSHQEPVTQEICISNGIGLSEMSELVEKGKEEVEETKLRLEEERLRGEMMKLEKQKEARSGRTGRHSRSSSTVESAPVSPTAQWTRERVKQVVEEI